MATPRFSIVITTWNGLKHLQRCLPSIVASVHHSFEVIVVDNASTDETLTWLASKYPCVKAVALNSNFKYGGGNNRAIHACSGDIVIFLNNDVTVDTNWLRALDQAFSSDPDLTVAQPKILSLLDPQRFEYAGAAGGYLDRYGYPFCRGRIFSTIEKDMGQYDQPVDILWASGAALAIRKSVFVGAGGFDDDFGLHMEELDLCWRLLNRGHMVRFVPASCVYHLGGGSLPTGSYKKSYYNYRNNLFMLWKNLTAPSFYKRMGTRSMLDFAATIRALLLGRWFEVAAIAAAYSSFAWSLSRLCKKRRILQSRRTVVSDPPQMIDCCIPFEYFIRKHKTYTVIAKTLCPDQARYVTQLHRPVIS